MAWPQKAISVMGENQRIAKCLLVFDVELHGASIKKAVSDKLFSVAIALHYIIA